MIALKLAPEVLQRRSVPEPRAHQFQSLRNNCGTSIPHASLFPARERPSTSASLPGVRQVNSWAQTELRQITTLVVTQATSVTQTYDRCIRNVQKESQQIILSQYRKEQVDQVEEKKKEKRKTFMFFHRIYSHETSWCPC